MARPVQHLRHRGFTLLELLIVGIIGTMVLAAIANIWRWYGHSVSEQQTEVMLTQELKLASEAIAQDYGPALASRTVDGSQIQFDLDGGAEDGAAQWASPDTVVEYSIVSGSLLRQDLNAETGIPLASHMQSLDVQAVSGHLELTLTAAFRNTQRTITLRLAGT